MKRFFAALLLLLVVLTAFADELPRSFIDGELAGTYRYEGEGFGGEFTITLFQDGTYSFYEGYLSSYIGGGHWTVQGNRVTLTEENGYDWQFNFLREGDTLIFIEADSDSFMYVQVPDGGRFIKIEAAEDEESQMKCAIKQRSTNYE